jgi:hypothetical protein
MRGGDSAQFYLPYFEADVKDSKKFGTRNSNLVIKRMVTLTMFSFLNFSAMQSVGAIAILFCLMFIICSFMLVQGVRKEYRGLFFPWMICMTLVVLFQAVYGLWIIIGYYIVSFIF